MVRNEVRIVNQEILLKQLYRTGQCSSLLVEKDGEIDKSVLNKVKQNETQLMKHFMRWNLPTKRQKTSDENEADGSLLHGASFYFSPGYFACPVVSYHWFFIHPRLRHSIHGANLYLSSGYEILRQRMEHFAVRNRRNLYVFGDIEENIFYMRLFTDVNVLKNGCIFVPNSLRLEAEQKFQTSVLLTIHGVRNPGDKLQSLIQNLQKKLDYKILEEIANTFRKNPDSRLMEDDMKFIQRDASKPDAVFFCTLPVFVGNYLGTLYFYLKQQIMTFTSIARFRENKGNSSRKVYFSSYLTPDNSFGVSDSYVPQFFIISRPPVKGSSLVGYLGLACLEARIVTALGQILVDMPYASYNQGAHSTLSPASIKLRQSQIERFHELTRCINTALPLPESLSVERPGNLIYLVQFNIWQIGDVGIVSLQSRFRLAVQQALCDLVTEFGLLCQPIVDFVTSPSPQSVRTIALPLNRTDRLSSLRCRSSGDAPPTSPVINSHSVQITTSPTVDLVLTIREPLSANRLRPLSSTMFSFDDPKKDSVSFPQQSKILSSDHNSILSLTIPTKHEISEQNGILNSQFVTVASKWFDYVVSEVKTGEQQFSVKKHLFHLDSDPSTCKVLLFYYFVLFFHLSDDGRIVSIDGEEIQYIILGYNQYYMDYFSKLEENGASSPFLDDFLCNKNNFSRFLPQIFPFVPRQRMVFFIARGAVACLYLYNYSAESSEQIYKLVASAAAWHNAKSRLLREIGLHKMGITHLGGYVLPNDKGLVWLNAELLAKDKVPEDGLAQFDERFAYFILAQNRDSTAEETRVRMKLYRHSDTAFLAMNLVTTFFENQSQQMCILDTRIRAIFRDKLQFRRIHQSLLSDNVKISEADLLQITSHSREVHFVRSPLLFFPAWRKKIAEIRRGTDDYANLFQPLLPQGVSSRRASGSRLSRHEVPFKAMKIRSNTLSVLHDGSQANQVVYTYRRAEKNDPCFLKIQFMLVQSYVAYALKLGLVLLDVTDIEQSKGKGNRYSLNFDTQVSRFCFSCKKTQIIVFQSTKSPPEIWMAKVSTCGIIFVNLTFVDAYFSLRVLMWSCVQSYNILNFEIDTQFYDKYEGELEALKNDIVLKCHFHSFTYDFHLRMVATYLVGGHQVLFDRGYNTNAFLIDFLQYYGCRPPYTRNCIYEEKVCLFFGNMRSSFSLLLLVFQVEYSGLEVDSDLVWEHFLSEKNGEWRVVELRDDRNKDVIDSDRYMLVSEEQKELFALNYCEVRGILRESRASSEKSCLTLKFYVILVSHERTDPFIENLDYDSQNLDCGEFKELEGLNGSTENEESSVSQLDTDSESIAYEKCERRRYRSGGSSSVVSALEFNRRLSNETPIASEYLPLFSGECCRLSIQYNAPRRHRKVLCKRHGSKIPVDTNILLPKEQVIYVHFLSERQKKLQEELEDSVLHYKRRLQKLVEDASWHCLRDELWRNMIEWPSKQKVEPLAGPRKIFENNAEASFALRSIISSNLTVNDIDKLLSYVKVISIIDYEPMIDALTSDINVDSFFKYLCLHFGEKNCRYFYSPLKKVSFNSFFFLLD
ncbi:unnamed protein product [Dracunculus medinensis]|uniref:DNA polymerase delta subunit 3 n=1 Tax=Dracunculus medinensis TaxID=318479 RepID=A0A158Q499_DRAME|nr:unnamed protein product [Dracunculus medinensis]